MIILGLETSCDETAAALLEINRGHFKLLANIVSSSVKLQAKYGGVVPEVAARKQVEYIIPVLEKSLLSAVINRQPPMAKKFKKSKNLKFPKSAFDFVKDEVGRSLISDFGFVTAIAVTVGPGLAVSLQVGIDTAKTLSYVWQKPIIPVNHLAGHLLSPLLAEVREITNTKYPPSQKTRLPNSTRPLNRPGFRIQNFIKLPAIGLIVSGGHTELVLVKDYLKYKLLGRTRDDAAGEAFDKVAKLLGLGYPGGPAISKLAAKGNAAAFDLPRGMINSRDYDFSFSGLKTAVLYKLRDLGYKSSKFNPSAKQAGIQNSKLVKDICASFQLAVVDVLVAKTMKAVKEYQARTLLVGGGVAANPLLRQALIRQCRMMNVECRISPLEFTGDNAAMIALAGYFRYRAGNYIKPKPQLKSWQQITAQPTKRLV